MDFSILISNPLINVGVVSWILAQAIKTVLDALKHRAFNRQRLAGAGGMPSSHSAVCCSVVLTSYFLYGFQSPVFALAFIVALIVMYDATGVRWAAGLHAKAINQIVEYLESGDVNDQEKSLNDLIPKLNESLGHRVIEVICGALLGIAVAVTGQILRQGGLFFFQSFINQSSPDSACSRPGLLFICGCAATPPDTPFQWPAPHRQPESPNTRAPLLPTLKICEKSLSLCRRALLRLYGLCAIIIWF